MGKRKIKRLISLTQSEVIGLDDDEYIRVNVTQLKKKVFLLIVSFGYMLNGFAVGWSSNISAEDDGLSSPYVSTRDSASVTEISPTIDTEYEYEFDGSDSEIIWSNNDTSQFQRHQISWIISAFPLGVVIMSIILCKCYYVVGTKVSILTASLLINISWVLIAFFGKTFALMFAARFIGGLGSGVIFILSGVYLKELMGARYNRKIVDLLITQFGLGIFLQYLLDLTSLMQPAVMAIALTTIFCLFCSFLPESPRYLAYCEMQAKDNTDFTKEIELHAAWGSEDLQRKSIRDLYDELKKLDLLPLMGLILVEQFIGGISILFYMKHFATLTGGFSPKLISTAVGLTLILSIPVSRLLRFRKISTTKRQIVVSTLVILFCMIALGVYRITEGSIGQRFEFWGLNHLPMHIFIVMTFFHIVGISRNSLLIVQHVLTSYSLQLHLRTVTIGVTWFFVFIITKILPQILYQIGVGYFYCFLSLIVLVALDFICKIMPSSFNLDLQEEVITARHPMETSIVISVDSIETPSSSHSSECSSL